MSLWKEKKKKTTKKLTPEEIELLLDPDRIKEAAEKYGEQYNNLYDKAVERAVEAVYKCENAEKHVAMLNGVIAEQERQIDRMEKQTEKMKTGHERTCRLKREMKKFIKEMGFSKDVYTSGQIDTMRYVMRILEPPKKKGVKNDI